MSTIIYLLRHADSLPSTDIPEPDWPLSERGKTQAESLVDRLSGLGIERIYTSPYPRAILTVVPFAAHRGLQPVLVVDLRERKLTNHMVKDFHALLRRTWLDFDYKMPGCESSRKAQQRVQRCLSNLARSNPRTTLLVSSHGNAIALYLNRLDPRFGYDQWREISKPRLYRVV